MWGAGACFWAGGMKGGGMAGSLASRGVGGAGMFSVRMGMGMRERADTNE